MRRVRHVAEFATSRTSSPPCRLVRCGDAKSSRVQCASVDASRQAGRSAAPPLLAWTTASGRFRPPRHLALDHSVPLLTRRAARIATPLASLMRLIVGITLLLLGVGSLSCRVEGTHKFRTASPPLPMGSHRRWLGATRRSGTSRPPDRRSSTRWSWPLDKAWCLILALVAFRRDDAIGPSRLAPSMLCATQARAARFQPIFSHDSRQIGPLPIFLHGRAPTSATITHT